MRSTAARIARWAPWLLAATLSIVGSHARAQTTSEPSAADIGVARDQFRAGVAAAHAQQWPQAVAAFRRSYELYPRPLTLFNLAGAEASVGHLVDATEHYRRFLREATSGPEAAQRRTAEEAIAALEPRIPRVRVVVAGIEPDDVVTMDGATVSRAALGAPYPVDPGHHELRVTRHGHDVATGEVTAAEGSVADVSLTVHELPVVSVTAGAAPSSSPPTAVVTETPHATGGGGLMTYGPYVVAGLGAAGLIASAVFFGLRQSAVSTLDSMCSNGPQGEGICPDTPALRSAYSNANTFNLATEIALPAGAVLFAGGVVWWIVARRHPAEHATVAVQPLPGGATLTIGGSL